MKPIPASVMQRAIASGARSILTPSAPRTSAAPERDDSARLPCLATGTPAPATMRAAQVEILNEPEASPPVPTTSMAFGGAATRNILERMTATAPAISSTVSPRTRIPISSAPICDGVASLENICSNALADSSRVSVAPVATLPMSPLNVSVTAVSSMRRHTPARRRHVGRPVRPAPLVGIPGGRDIEKILQHQVTVLGSDALGMELHAMQRQLFVRQSHDEAVVRFRGHAQRRRKARAIDDQRVIACRLERRVDAAQDAGAVVADGRKLAVHRDWRADDGAAESVANRLMAEADPKHRDFAGNRPDQIEADTGVLGSTRAGRKHDGVGIGGHNGGAGDPVVAMHAHLRPKVPEEMDQVEGEAVVIVDQDNHKEPGDGSAVGLLAQIRARIDLGGVFGRSRLNARSWPPTGRPKPRGRLGSGQMDCGHPAGRRPRNKATNSASIRPPAAAYRRGLLWLPAPSRARRPRRPR